MILTESEGVVLLLQAPPPLRALYSTVYSQLLNALEPVCVCAYVCVCVCVCACARVCVCACVCDNLINSLTTSN